MTSYDAWKQESDRQYKMVSAYKYEHNGNFIDSVGYIDFTGSNSRTVNTSGLNNTQIIYILEGYGYYTINNEKFKASQGDIVLIPENIPHKYNYNAFENTKVFFIHFKGKDFDHLLSHSLSSHYHIGIQNKLCERFSDIISTLKSNQLFSKEIAINLSLVLVAEVISKISTQKNPITCKLAPAITTINLHPDKNLSLEDYSRMCLLSVSCFSREFKKYTGFSPIEYRNFIRIDKAKKMIITNNLPLSEISSILGFSSYPQFFEQFKKHTGFPPKRFREINSFTI